MSTELEQEHDEAGHDSPREGAAFGNALDWGLASNVGAKIAPRGPNLSRYTRDKVYAELADASKRAEAPVRDVTGLADGLAVPEALIVDRAGWVRAAAASMAELTGADPASVGRLRGKPGGLQAGGMLAFLSTAILGQYDPFTGEDGTLLLVAPNVVMVERALHVNPSDFRLWVCLHEVTHRVQFSANPWLADYMRDNVAALGDVAEESMAEVAERLLALAKRRRGSDELAYEDRGVVGFIRATAPPPQREALDNLLMLGTLLEGHADHVMDAVGPAVVPTVEDIRAAFDSRRRKSRNPLQRLIRALLGMDAKMEQYVRGKKFVDEVVAEAGMANFNTIWTGPETLPRPSEVDAPQEWIKRVLA